MGEEAIKLPKTIGVYIAIDTIVPYEPIIAVADTAAEMGKLYGITAKSVREAVARKREGEVSGRRFERIQIAAADEEDKKIDKILFYNTETFPRQENA